MKKSSSSTPAVAEAERREQAPELAAQATRHDADQMRRSVRHRTVRSALLTSHRQRSRMRFKQAPSSTAAAGRHRLGALVRVRKRIQRVSRTRLTAYKRFLHAFLYVFLPKRHTREHALWLREGGTASTTSQPVRHSRPAQRPATVHRRPHTLPAPTARMHTAPRHSANTRGGRRGQPRERPAADTPSRGTTASAGTAALPALPSVLVVDDDPAYRQLLREIFTLEGRLEGRAIYMAEHGGPALHRLRASAEGMVVLFGLLMPQVDGEAVLEALAANTSLARRHAFVIVTAAIPLACGGRVAELRRLLDIPLIIKPFTVSEILQAVDDATRRLT